jgi:hypothetical protein
MFEQCPSELTLVVIYLPIETAQNYVTFSQNKSLPASVFKTVMIACVDIFLVWTSKVNNSINHIVAAGVFVLFIVVHSTTPISDAKTDVFICEIL